MRLLCADDEPDIRAILEVALSLEPAIELDEDLRLRALAPIEAMLAMSR